MPGGNTGDPRWSDPVLAGTGDRRADTRPDRRQAQGDYVDEGGSWRVRSSLSSFSRPWIISALTL
jgi:hypothetical protein